MELTLILSVLVLLPILFLMAWALSPPKASKAKTESDEVNHLLQLLENLQFEYEIAKDLKLPLELLKKRIDEVKHHLDMLSR